MKRFKVFQITLYAIFFICVYALALFIGRVLELTLLLTSYFALRYTFVKTWHADTTLKCITTSIVVFWIAESFVLPKEISILCSIMFGFLITFALYLIQDYLDLKCPPLTLRDLDKERLDILVKRYKLNDLARTRLSMRYIDKMTCRQIAENENVELEAIETYFRRLKKRLK